MKDQSGTTSDQQQNIKRRPVIKASLGFIFGAVLGLILGNMFDSSALGLIFGAFVGLVFGAALDRRNR